MKNKSESPGSPALLTHTIDPAELEMVHEIAAHRWRLQRSWSIETATIDNEMDLQSTTPHTDEPVRLASAFKSLSDNSQSLDVLGRYEYRLRRQFERALNDYMRLRDLAAVETHFGQTNQPRSEKTAC